MFWFVVAMVFLIIWLSERSRAKKDNNNRYNQGWWDAYAYVRDKIEKLPHTDQHTVKRVFNEIEGKSEETATTVAASTTVNAVELDPGAVFREDELTENTEQFAEPQVYTEAIAQPEPLTPEQLAAEKERKTLQNLNVMLYVGSLLIVAAAAVFVTLVMPAAVKLSCLVILTAIFYVSGLVLHANSERLRPAGLAFAGTGLAILPFVGFALTSLGGLSGSTAWLITSIVGLLAYGFAAVRLQSQLISYLTIAFALSFSLSAVSTLGLGILWYFIVVIGVSILFNSVHYLFPTTLPAIFWQPVEQTSVVLTPVALVGSLLSFGTMDRDMYLVLFGVATAHYMVVWLERRLVAYELAVRVLGHISALIAVDVATSGLLPEDAKLVFWLGWLGMAAVQVLYSLLRVYRERPASMAVESAALGISLGAMVIALPSWIRVEHVWTWVSINTVFIGATATAIALRLRQSGWLYGALIALAALPMTISRGMLTPPANYEYIAMVFVVMAAVGLMMLERLRSTGRSAALQMVAATGVILYSLMAAGCGLLSGEALTLAWTLLAAAAAWVVLSYLVDAPVVVEVLGVVLLVFSVSSWIEWMQTAPEWHVVATSVVAAALVGAGAVTHHLLGERARRNALAVVAVGVFSCLLFAALGGEIAVVRTVVWLLLGGGVAALVLRAFMRGRSGFLGSLGLAVYLTYPFLATLLAFGNDVGLTTIASLVLAVTLMIASYLEAVPYILAFGNAALLVTLFSLWQWLGLADEWMLFGVAWMAAGVYYLQYWLTRSHGDIARQSVSLFYTLGVLVFSSVLYFFALEPEFVARSAVSLLLASAVLAIHGALGAGRTYIELAVYGATLALQRLVSVYVPEANLVLYGHWWAAVLLLVALWLKDSAARVAVALGCITFTTGMYALLTGDSYTLLFLVEHIVIGVVGALVNRPWIMWWGVISVILAVLYFLRNYTAFALLFLGLLLIVFVIWRLLKVGKKK